MLILGVCSTWFIAYVKSCSFLICVINPTWLCALWLSVRLDRIKWLVVVVFTLFSVTQLVRTRTELSLSKYWSCDCVLSLQTPTTISLPLRFWDLSVAQYRTVEPRCTYEGVPEIPTPPSQSVSPSPPSVINGPIVPSVLSTPKVSCSSHQMTLELPSGPISEIVVKGRALRVNACAHMLVYVGVYVSCTYGCHQLCMSCFRGAALAYSCMGNCYFCLDLAALKSCASLCLKL